MSQPQFLEVADSIGRLLCRDALWSGSECNWLGWGMHPDAGAWRLASKAQPATLYDGTAGIGLFLARLFQFTGDARLAKASPVLLDAESMGLQDTADFFDQGMPCIRLRDESGDIGAGEALHSSLLCETGRDDHGHL